MLPVIAGLASRGRWYPSTPTKPSLPEAVANGAVIINDISGLQDIELKVRRGAAERRRRGPDA